MTKNFTPKAKEALECAKRSAEKLGHTYIGSEHLLMGIMCTECVASKLLDDKKVLYTDVYDNVVRISGSGTPTEFTYCAFTPKCKKILETSGVFASKYDGKFIGSEHILYGICDSADCVASRILATLGITLSGLKGEICSFLEMGTEAAREGKSNIAGAPSINTYGINLNSLALKDSTDPLIERDRELERIIRILSRRTKNNPCLIGEPGVGKTAIVEGLAGKIAKGDVPDTLKGKIIVSLDISSMVAGAKYRGEFEERMRGVLNEARANPNIILFIDEIHVIIGAGSAEGAVDAANIIKPALARGNLRVIGATTVSEYRKHIERDAALERRFQPVYIEEPTEKQSISILKGLREKYEAHHGVSILDSAIEGAVYLSKRYITDRYLPDKAIDLIDEACSLAKLSKSDKSPEIKRCEKRIEELTRDKESAILSENFEEASRIRDLELSEKIRLSKLKAEYYNSLDSVAEIDKNDISRVISGWTKIPVSRLSYEENERLLLLEEILSKRVIGQRDAVKSVAVAIKRGRLGLKNPKRPVGSFLFLGPTGVGKTHLAKCLADEMFNSGTALIRLDMSEYAEKHSISRLIGSPPGYVGHDEGGILTEAVRKKPYSVVLFDEIEKAHSDIYNILLQILDDGVLTDSRGRKIDFKSCVIILTSNIGADLICEQKRFGFQEKTDTSPDIVPISDINARLKKHFSPEFLNRLDETVIFGKLSTEDAVEITSLLLSSLTETVKNTGINISFDMGVAKEITNLAYSVKFGARPLARAITTYIENPLSDEILSGNIREGDTVLCHFDKAASFEKIQ